MKTANELNQLAGQIVDAAMEVHRELGCGVLERVYEAGMEEELLSRGIRVRRRVPQPIVYKGKLLDDEGYRLDLLVEDSVIVELKTVAEIAPIHEAQLISYLRLSDKRLGLLINFRSVLLKNGIKRRVHNFPKV